jgi:hypothetical protein
MIKALQPQVLSTTPYRFSGLQLIQIPCLVSAPMSFYTLLHVPLCSRSQALLLCKALIQTHVDHQLLFYPPLPVEGWGRKAGNVLEISLSRDYNWPSQWYVQSIRDYCPPWNQLKSEISVWLRSSSYFTRVHSHERQKNQNYCLRGNAGFLWMPLLHIISLLT